MKRHQRLWALPKKESKVVTRNRRTICTTIDPPEDRKDYFSLEPFKRNR